MGIRKWDNPISGKVLHWIMSQEYTNSGDLSGESAVVTGAAGQIGTATCFALADSGADVIAADTREVVDDVATENLRNYSNSIQYYYCDVTQPEHLEDLRREATLGNNGVDILITADNVISYHNIKEMSERTWEKEIGVILTGTFLSIKEFYPYLTESNPGRIICVGLNPIESGKLNLSPSTAAAFGGVHSIVRNISETGEADGVVVNAVALKPMNRGVGKTEEDFSGYDPKEENEIAEAILQLALGDAGGQTGEILNVTGNELRET